MIRPIVLYGNEVLRTPCTKIEKNDMKALGTVIDDMWETMYNASGVGLATPQIGLSMQLFVIDSSPLAKEITTSIKRVFINPHISEEDEVLNNYEEGCLSIPGISEKINRPKTIRIHYYDEDFKPKTEPYEGINARVIQHEYDHLQGKLFIDYLPPLRKQLIKKRLSNIAAGIVDTHYPTLQ